MDLYQKTAYELSRILTDRYSTSFSLSIKLFEKTLRPHIYAIYGLVRIADEIVDTYKGKNATELLDELEQHVYSALQTGYSPNPIVQAFVSTARRYGIESSLLSPFFTSMRMDLETQFYDEKKYARYIDGSAEVVGLMCLKVFVDEKTYERLEPGARRLGAAYQKVNFLRDIAADHDELKRWYFPYGSFEAFDESLKHRIVKEIEKDFGAAKRAIDRLPLSARKAVLLSYQYYQTLLQKIDATPAELLKTRRIRVPNTQKLLLLAKTATKRIEA